MDAIEGICAFVALLAEMTMGLSKIVSGKLKGSKDSHADRWEYDEELGAYKEKSEG